VKVGTKIRLAGMGEPKADGQGAEDLYLVLEEPEVTTEAPQEAPPPLPWGKSKSGGKGILVSRFVIGFLILIGLAVAGVAFTDYRGTQQAQARKAAIDAAEALKLIDDYLEVPREFASVAKAIRSAEEGMTVRLATGVYSEKIYLSRGVNIEGSGGEGETVVAVSGTETALNVEGVEGVTISNLTFRHTSTNESDARAPLVSLNDAKVRFYNNRIESSGGYGVSMRNGGGSVIEDNVITGAVWGGILIYEKGVGTIRNNQIINNEGKGIEIRDSGEPVLVTRNQISRNGSNGVWVKSATPMRIIGNTLEGNGQIIPNSGGIGIGELAVPTLVANKSTDNDGDGIWWRDDAKPLIGADNFSDGEALESNF